MHAELVEKRLDQRGAVSARAELLHAAAGTGGAAARDLRRWLLHRTWGGVVAGALFVLPSMFIFWALSFVYVTFGQRRRGSLRSSTDLKPAVLAIVAAAVIRIGSKALKNEVMWALAALAFVAHLLFQVPFPIIILGAAMIGLIGGRRSAGEVSSAVTQAEAAPGATRRGCA